MTTVAENIKNARKARGYTQKDLARLLQVKPAAVSAWEVGRNEPSIAMLRKIAELLGAPFDRLVGVETDNDTKDKPLTKNQKLVAYSIDPNISDEERNDIIEMVKIAMKNRRRV